MQCAVPGGAVPVRGGVARVRRAAARGALTACLGRTAHRRVLDHRLFPLLSAVDQGGQRPEQRLLVVPVLAGQLFQEAQRRDETQWVVPLYARVECRQPSQIREFGVLHSPRVGGEAHVSTSVVRSASWCFVSFAGSAFVTCTRLAPAVRTVTKPSIAAAGQSSVDSTRDEEVKPRTSARAAAAVTISSTVDPMKHGVSPGTGVSSR